MPIKIPTIISKARDLVEPKEEEAKKADQIASALLIKVKKLAAYHPLRPKVALGGSFAKGTWLKDALDIDIFVLFPRAIDADKLEHEGLLLARQSLSGQRPRLRYAQHPYLEGSIQGVRINLVPCFETRIGEWKSAADRSPFHTDYMNEHLTNRLRTEVRLLKLFMKGVGCYGSEIKVQGFSGYACEILILKYGTFVSALDNVSNWSDREVLCIEPSAKAEANRHKGPLVITDPIDKHRNLGAAISQQKIGRFVMAASSFLRSPRISYFRKTRRGANAFELELVRRSAVGVILSHSTRSPDVLWGQLKKSDSHLRARLSSEGYEVARNTIASDEQTKSALLYLIVNRELPSLLAKEGPEYFRVAESRKYIEKNSGSGKITWVGESGRLRSLRLRPDVSNLESFIEELIKSKTSGISQGLRVAFTNSRILDGEKLLLESKAGNWLSEGLQNLVSSEKL
ncbi:MAG: CCA tRNA nucleotidyltransferase [Nitrososphaerales archaeon]